MSSKDNKKYMFNLRVNNLSREEVYELEDTCVKNTRKIAPDSMGTSIICEQGQLPSSNETKNLQSGD